MKNIADFGLRIADFKTRSQETGDRSQEKEVIGHSEIQLAASSK